MKPLVLLVASAWPALAAGAPAVVASSPIPNPPGGLTHYAAVGALARVASANNAARVQPSSVHVGASQTYAWTDGALFQVYAQPDEVTDIVLQPGEQLQASKAVAAGDTVRWEIGSTTSGQGAAERVHLIVKPTRPGLRTNLIVNTDRRTYYLELQSTTTTYMPAVDWTYPPEPVVAKPPPPVAPPVPSSLEAVNFDYRITGDRTPWRPTRVYDDGRQTVIEFPSTVAQAELPPVFVNGADGKPTNLVNYRVSGQRIVVDRLFDKAELKLGQGSAQRHVDIERLRRAE